MEEVLMKKKTNAHDVFKQAISAAPKTTVILFWNLLNLHPKEFWPMGAMVVTDALFTWKKME